MAREAWLLLAAAFGTGLLLGSFLNVCIARLPYRESIATPGSHCPGCMFPIRWHDNVPIVSFLLLRGRCRRCFQRISWRYPVVEFGVAAWFAIAMLRAMPSALRDPNALYTHPAQPILGIELAVLGWFLIGLAFTDWETHLLPDALTWPGIVLGLLLVCTQAIFLAPGAGDIHLHNSMRMSSPGSMVERGDVFLTGPEALVFGRIAAVVVAAGMLLLIRAAYKAFRGQHGMGLGDVKLLALIAAFLGFWPSILALFLGVISCALFAAVLLVRGRASRTSQLPFGSFLAVGGLVAALVGAPLLHWYRNLF